MMGILEKLFNLGGTREPLPENAILIDVRSPAEFAAGHIGDAIPLPLNCLARDIGNVVIDKATPIIVYCQSGGRSLSARRQLLGMGYAHVINGGGVRALAARMKREIRPLVFPSVVPSCSRARSPGN